MTKQTFISVPLYCLMGCSEDINIQLSSPDLDPVAVKIKREGPFEPIQVNASGGGIDLRYRTTYAAPGKRVFKVLLSNGKPEKFAGYDFAAVFHPN